MNHVFDRYRAPGLAKIHDAESWQRAMGVPTSSSFAQANLRDGGRPAIAAEGVSHPAGPGQDVARSSFFDGGMASTCTTVPATETPKEQAGLVAQDEWGV